MCPKCLLGAGPDVIYTQAGARTAEEADLAAVQELFPQLQVVARLGRGGMGVVYKARQPHLDRFVAIKLLAPEIAADGDFASRFLREARALARLNHPNIVGVHDFGKQDGTYYLVMEFVDGTSLREVMQHKVMTPDEALGVVPQLCAGLQYAHEQGIVHRDIKPENILLDTAGQVKIADFGLAKLLDGSTDTRSDNLTRANQVMGTPHYMAPEQVNRPTEVDHRADIYSLGVVFYEMLTHELPLGRFARPSEKVHVDVRLDRVVARALEQEPEQRYQAASEVRTDVERVSKSGKGALGSMLVQGTRLAWIEDLDRDTVLGVAFAGLAGATLWFIGLLMLDRAYGNEWILLGYPACFLGHAVVRSRALDGDPDERTAMQWLVFLSCSFLVGAMAAPRFASEAMLIQCAAGLFLAGGHLYLDRWIFSGRGHMLVPAVLLWIAATVLHCAAGRFHVGREALGFASGMLAVTCGSSIVPALPEYARREVPGEVTRGVLRALALGVPATAIYFRDVIF